MSVTIAPDAYCGPIYIFLDTETTGLTVHDGVWQIAWIAEDENGLEIGRQDVLVNHYVAPSKWVLRNTAYAARLSAENAFPVALSDAVGAMARCILRHIARDPRGDRYSILRGFYDEAYIVGANPALKDRFIRKIVPNPPWNYHLIDIEAVFMGRLGLSTPPNLEEIAKIIGVEDERPHDAMSDAQLVREAWAWLRVHRQLAVPV